MRLYHPRCWAIRQATCSRKSLFFYFGILSIFLGLLSACTTTSTTPIGQVEIHLFADGKERTLQVFAGTNVGDALSQAGLVLDTLDRVEPPSFTTITPNMDVHLIRVQEEFNVEQQVIPFEHQVLKNESLPEGESRLIQPGVNGKQEVTYRRLIEDGREVSNTPVKSVVLEEAIPEIVMVGSQSPFVSFKIPGRLVYLSGGNAWLIDGNTGNRRPVVTSGDLDGRVFSLSPDGEWLLFSRKDNKEENINTLWVIKLDDSAQLVDLNVSNVIHFADWRPNVHYQIAYSTVEPRSSAPGWQANNDLNLINLNRAGQVKHLPVELDTNMGGKYGWWGTTYAWSPDGTQIVYARPDGIGFLLLGEKGALNPLFDLTTLQTGSDWAWVPEVSWSPDRNAIYTVDHVAPQGSDSPEQSPDFDLVVIPLYNAPVMHLVSQAGMFAYPKTSPLQVETNGEHSFQVAFLKAIFPQQSDTSRYRLFVMDRDGSNQKVLFPAEGAPGLQPQNGWGAWSPANLPDKDHQALAVIYQNNLWIVDTQTGESSQITGDGLVSQVDWK